MGALLMPGSKEGSLRKTKQKFHVSLARVFSDLQRIPYPIPHAADPAMYSILINKIMKESPRALKGATAIAVAVLLGQLVRLLIFCRVYSDFLLNSLNGPLRYDDPALIQYIKEKVLIPPSNKPYDIVRHPRMYTLVSEIFYRNFTERVFAYKRHGFFVEAGALDGQVMSNTLQLEINQGWSGLLVEPDPSNYIALKKKHRKAWTAKACLSMTKYPKEEKFSSYDITSNNHKFRDINQRSMGSIVEKFRNSSYRVHSLQSDETANSYYTTQCFPLASFLLALDVTQVDLLSLDVEFGEEQIIRNFPFERFNVQVIFLEWWIHEKLPWLKEFMEENNYLSVINQPGDIIFVKADSEVSKVVDQERLWQNFIVYKTANNKSIV